MIFDQADTGFRTGKETSQFVKMHVRNQLVYTALLMSLLTSQIITAGERPGRLWQARSSHPWGASLLQPSCRRCEAMMPGLDIIQIGLAI